MSDRVQTITGVRLRLSTANSPVSIDELRLVMNLLGAAVSGVEVRHTVALPDGDSVDKWVRVDFRIAELRPGSVDLLIVAAGGFVATAKGLPALLTFMQGLHDWKVDHRIKFSEARKAEAEADKAEAEADKAEAEADKAEAEADKAEAEVAGAAGSSGRSLTRQREARRVLSQINATIADPDVRIVLRQPSSLRSRKRGARSIQSYTTSNLLRLAYRIESVDFE